MEKISLKRYNGDTKHGASRQQVCPITCMPYICNQCAPGVYLVPVFPPNQRTRINGIMLMVMITNGLVRCVHAGMNDGQIGYG